MRGIITSTQCDANCSASLGRSGLVGALYLFGGGARFRMLLLTSLFYYGVLRLFPELYYGAADSIELERAR